MDKIAPPVPTVEEATRVINHLLSYPDHCEATLDAVRSIMQWMSFERPTEAHLYRHLKTLRKPIPEGIREGVDHVPTTRHRTTIIVEGVLKGYLDWLRKVNPQTEDSFQNHPETGDDVEPGEPHPSHHILIHDSLGASQQQEVCGYCGKTNALELAEPCPVARWMNEQEDAHRASGSAPDDAQFQTMRDTITEALSSEIGGDTFDCTRVWEAWSVGTMGEDDFVPVSDRLDEITETVVTALTSHPIMQRATQHELAMANFPSLQRRHGPDNLKPIEDWYRQYIKPMEGQ